MGESTTFDSICYETGNTLYPCGFHGRMQSEWRSGSVVGPQVPGLKPGSDINHV